MTNLFEKIAAAKAAKEAKEKEGSNVEETQTAPSPETQAPAATEPQSEQSPAGVFAGARRPTLGAPAQPPSEPSAADAAEASGPISSPEVEPAPAPAPQPSAFQMPRRRAFVASEPKAPAEGRTSASEVSEAPAEANAEPTQAAQPASPAHVLKPPKRSAPALGGALGALKSASAARAAAPVAPAMTGINPEARTAVEAGVSYSAEDMLEDLNSIEAETWDEEDERDIKARDEARAEVLRKGCEALDQIYETHMASLQTGTTSDFTVAEMARIVKLTFLRVKSAPNAYAMLDLEDRAKLLKAMRAMADKRMSATTSRKKNEAKEFSSAAEILSTPEPGVDEAMSMLGDLGFGV